nr:integrase, catalytic region, zinc finger, CCHC-type, peptidase aspartic, catalytic [Tanacetum cinerariifolium]
MQVVQIVLWYLDFGCSKHMTGDRSQLINFVQKFIGTVKFGNDHVEKIMGYGDYKIGNASKTKSWLWHRRLSHLNFGAINYLARQGLVRGLLKLKFKKYHLCSACAMGKNFDELTAMASEQSSLRPALNEDLLFQPMFNELLNPPPSVDNQAPEVIAPIVEVIPPVQADSTGSPSSTTVDQDAPSPSKSHTTPETQSSVIPQDVKEDNLDIKVAHIRNDPLFGVTILKVTSAQSSSTVYPHPIVQPDHQIPQHNSKWTKDHPLQNIISQLSRLISTRLQLYEQAFFYYYCNAPLRKEDVMS